MADNGRSLLLQRSTDGGTTYTTIAGIRTKSFTVGNEPVDVTDDDSAGWRELLAEPGNRTIDISGSGVSDDDILLGLALAATGSFALEDAQIVLPSGATIECSFFINSFSETGEYNGATTFEISMQSSGTPTFTAA